MPEELQSQLVKPFPKVRRFRCVFKAWGWRRTNDPYRVINIAVLSWLNTEVTRSSGSRKSIGTCDFGSIQLRPVYVSFQDVTTFTVCVGYCPNAPHREVLRYANDSGYEASQLAVFRQTNRIRR